MMKKSQENSSTGSFKNRVLTLMAAIVIIILFIGIKFFLPDSQEGQDTNKVTNNYYDVSSENNVFASEGSTKSDSNTTLTVETEASPTSLTFRNEQYLKEHYEKHGKDMGFNSPEEYLAAANKVISDPNALHKKEAEDNDDIYYLEDTNEFVVVSTDGYIRTYFCPDKGIDYYNRQ